MCTVCGCGTASVEGAKAHDHDHGHHHHHHYGHHHDHDHGHQRHDGSPAPAVEAHASALGAAVPGVSPERLVAIERAILSKNDAYAEENRALFARLGVFALNFVSSPGSGKTTLLARVIADLKDKFPIAVIEGDQQTSNDAERIRAAGAPAVQINTGKGCHLDAHMVAHGLGDLPLEKGALLFIENVGNLVCPAAFDLGEAHKVVVLSATEGEDKPLKYPEMFVASDLLLLNKSDLLPHLDFDVGQCLAYALKVNPDLQTLVVSAKTGEGLPAFYAWLEGRAARAARRAHDASVTARA